MMGIELSLCPVEKGLPYSFTRITLNRRTELFMDIKELPSEYDPQITAYIGEEGKFVAVKDTEKASERTVTIAQLLTLRDHDGVQDNDENRAAWAYLSARDPSLRVLLHWW